MNNHKTKDEIFFRLPNGEFANADDLPRNGKNPQTKALIALAYECWNWNGMEHRHGDTLLQDGTFVPPAWNAPVLPRWVTGEGEPCHMGSILLPSKSGEWSGVVEVWKRPSR